MSNRKMKGMFDILEEELCALIEVVSKVDAQAASTFNRNLREQTQKLRKEEKKIMDAMQEKTAKIEALQEKQRVLMAEKEASLNRTKVLLDELKAALDMQQELLEAREARIARREAELGLSVISNLTDMAQA